MELNLLEEMVQETIESGSELLYINNEFVDSIEFLELVKDYQDKVSNLELDNKILYLTMDNIEYKIKIA